MFATGNTCRLCLATDVPVHVIAGTPLQDIYEKLTGISLTTPHRSVVACHLCYSRLRKCHNLMVRSVRADKVLTQIQQSGNMDEEEFLAMIKQYHLNDSLCVTPTELIAITNNKGSLIKDEIKEEPQLTRSKGVMTKARGILQELVKFEESEDEGDTKSGAPVDMEDMDSEEFINEGDVKMEVFEEPLNVERQESPGVDIKREAFEEVQDIATEQLIEEQDTRYDEIEVLGCDEPEDAAPNNRSKKTEDTATLISREENMGRGKRRAVLEEEISSRNTGIYKLRSTRNSGNKTPVSRDASVNSDNDCTSTETNVDNSGREHLKKVVISDECGDVSDDKCLLEEYHNVTGSSNRMSGEGSSHQLTLLRKQRCGRTGIVNRRTDSSKVKNLFECDVCQRRFTSKEDFNYHLRTHAGEKPLVCEICQKKFKKRSELKNHFRTHTGEKPFECNICMGKFGQKSYLKIHFRTHTGEKPFECEICKRKFILKGNLNTHLRTHTAEKPFKCNICESKFREKAHLKVHLRTHTGEKPFECDRCTSKFSQKCCLKVHLRTHTGEKPFKCNICESKFKDKGQLSKHLRKHTGEKPFECEICKRKFSLKGNLRAHLRTH